jgi:hypothetical protein
MSRFHDSILGAHGTRAFRGSIEVAGVVQSGWLRRICSAGAALWLLFSRSLRYANFACVRLAQRYAFFRGIADADFVPPARGGSNYQTEGTFMDRLKGKIAFITGAGAGHCPKSGLSVLSWKGGMSYFAKRGSSLATQLACWQEFASADLRLRNRSSHWCALTMSVGLGPKW